MLGVYNPPKWNRKIVLKQLINMSATVAGLTPLMIGKHRLHKGLKNVNAHADLMRRTPKYDTADLEWHRDGDITGADMDCGIVLWASNTPTQIMDKNGKIWTPKHREVIYFRNIEVKHRRPPNTKRVRWLFRQRVK